MSGIAHDTVISFMKCKLADEFLRHTHRHKVNKRDSIEIDAPQRHDANRIHSDHHYGEQVQKARSQVHAEQDTTHNECGEKTHGDVEQTLIHDGQILFVIHICNTAKWKMTESVHRDL